MNPDEHSLREAIELACQPQNASRIAAGRQRIKEMDQPLVLREIEEIARECLDLNDYWEYRRLLELCEILDGELAGRVASWGASSGDPDILEVSQDYAKNTESGSR